MSRSNWLPHIAFAGWLLALLLVAPNFAHLVTEVLPPNNPERHEQECRSRYQQAASKPNRPNAATEQKQAPADQGQDADPHKDAHEYCVQRRAAEAGERQADYSFWGLLLSGVALLGLFGTLVHTADAAKAAAKSASVAERALKITQRAYLSVEPLGIRQRRDGALWFGHIGIRNAGLLPARNVQWQISLEPFSANDDWNGFLYVHPRPGNHVIPPGTIMRQSTRGFAFDPRDRQEKWLYVWGEVTYTDGFGESRYTRFCHRYNNQTVEPDDKGGRWGPPEEARYHVSGNEAT